MNAQTKISPTFSVWRNGCARLKSAPYRTVLATVLLLVLWNLSAWFIAEHFYLAKVNDLIERKTVQSQQQTNDLADSIRRNLDNLQGIPDFLSGLLHVKWAASQFGADSAPSILPPDERRWRWTNDPGLNDLSRYLASAEKNLKADLIVVVNAAGDCIAASNWNTPESAIGANYADRDYFKKNKQRQRGMQYAMGRTTHIAGLYFSTPIILGGKFMGAVIAKADVPNLSFLIKQFDAFVADSNGIIILAREKELEMHALPDAVIASLSEQERLARYLVSSFPPLKIERWKDLRFASLMRFENESAPHVFTAKELPEFGLKVYVENEIASIPAMSQNNFWFILLLNALGSVLILAAVSLVLYFQSLKQSRALLWKKANFDTLTDLPNRDRFCDLLAQEIKEADRTARPLALLLIDLDQFKGVNEALGHHIGDLLLQETARRLVDCVREAGTVARLVGDEFTVVLPQLADTGHAKNMAKKIIASLAEPFHLHDEAIYLSASLGITLYPVDAANIDSLMRNADQAMYVAKSEGRNRYSYFTLSLQEAAQHRLHLGNDLRGALAGKQFMAYFQPIVELSTGRVKKAEVLLRWRHPLRGLVSPAEFIPLAEETRLIVEIGAWVRKESLFWCNRWNKFSPEGFQISVNKSPVEFMDEDDGNSVGMFTDDLHKLALNGKNFVFEITEGLLLNADQRINIKLMALRDAGIQVSIDDFGTGYSSLSYLKKFDIDYLKIDQSFVRNMGCDSDDLALCEAIIVMAHKLGLKVIAEGVETEQQRDLLSRAGCDYAQGYLFSRPIPPEEFEVWLKDRNTHW